MTAQIIPYTQDHLDALIARFEGGAAKFARYLQAQENGERLVLLCVDAGVVHGFITVVWESSYPRFVAQRAPEIVDLYVHETMRGKKMGARLLEAVEEHIQSRGFKTIGIAVGITPDFGPAQRLYATRGYVPDGSGLWHNGVLVKKGQTITLNDRTNIMMLKVLERSS
jgi:GNAT superfamily N-acetyltransferase